MERYTVSEGGKSYCAEFSYDFVKNMTMVDITYEGSVSRRPMESEGGIINAKRMLRGMDFIIEGVIA